MNEYSLYNPDSELAHHGILGMKWGVRRYQNPDGSLTPLGRKRFAASKKHPLLYRDKTFAKIIYKRESKDANRTSKAAAALSEQYRRKADKMRDADPTTASEYGRKAELYSQNSEEYKKVSDMFSQKVKDIKDGTIKQGEDFIVQGDYNWYGLFSTREYRIIEKPKNDAVINAPKENDITKQASLSNSSNNTSSEDKSSAAEPSRKTYKSDMMETARKTGKYDIDFLESIQNSYVLEGSKKERLREYSKYLDNPRTYVAPPETRPSPKSKTPKDKLASRAKAMQGQYTQAEIAEKLGISPSYVSSLLS